MVEEPTNIAAVEKGHTYNGGYHVLHGTLSPIHGVGPEQLRIANLMRRAESGSLDEVILATNPTVEGEATAVFLARSTEADRGTGYANCNRHPRRSDIEYADEVTLQRALEGRREM